MRRKEITAEHAVVPETEQPATIEKVEKSDLLVFEELQKKFNLFAIEKNEILALVEYETFSVADAENITQRLKTLLVAIGGMRERIDELIKPLREHALALHPQSYHPLLNTLTKTPDQFIYSLQDALPTLAKSQTSLEHAKETLEQAKEKESHKTQIINEKNDKLKTESEEQVQQGNGFLGFGILPKTRRQNQHAFEQAEKMIALINEIKPMSPELAAQKLEEAIRKEKWDAKENYKNLLELLGEYRKLEIQHITTSDADRKFKKEQLTHSRSFDNFKERIRKGLKEINLEEAEEALKSYQEKITTATSEIEQFDGFLTQEVFPSLHITEEDEQRVRAEALPEDTSDVLREARECSFENIRDMTTSFFAYFKLKGKTPKELLSILQTKTESIRQSAYIGYNDRSEDIRAVLYGKEIKPIFDLEFEHQKRSTTGGIGSKDIGIRKDIEQRLGFKENEHPTYLALGSSYDREHGPAPSYGAFHFSFSLEKLRNQTVCTVGDSLNDAGVPLSLRRRKLWGRGTTDEQSKRRQLTLEHGLLAKAFLELENEYEPKNGTEYNYLKAMNYVEAQVLGPVRVEDAEEIVLSRYSAALEIDSLARSFYSASHCAETIQEIYPNLTFRIDGNPPEDIKKFAGYRNYENFFKK